MGIMSGFVAGSLWGLVVGGVGLVFISQLNEQPAGNEPPATPQLIAPQAAQAEASPEGLTDTTPDVAREFVEAAPQVAAPEVEVQAPQADTAPTAAPLAPEIETALTVPEDGRFDAVRSLRHDYYYRGERMGTRIDLRIAAALAYAYGKTENREHWAMAKNDLGNVLQVLGSRGEEGALQEAVAAYRAALEVHTREAAPMNWAMTQNNLGNALRVLGERGEEGALQDAVAAYRAALEVRTREAAPMQWAMTFR